MFSRRSFLEALVGAPLAAQLLLACGPDASLSTVVRGSTPGNTSKTTGAPVPSDPLVPGPPALRSTLRSTTARTAGAAPSAAADAINAFADDLFTLLAATSDENLVFSPASIVVALAMASAGATGETLDQTLNTLHVSDATTLHPSMNGLLAHLESLNKSRDNAAEGGTGISIVDLSITNSLWAQDGFAFEPAFLDLLQAQYGAGVELVDYRVDPDGARRAINAWVDEATNQRIPELLGEGTISKLTRMTLVNAVYLRANWAAQFYAEATGDAAFTTVTGGVVSVPMMHRTGRMAYAEGDGWQAIDIPYVFGDLTLTVAMGAAATTLMPSADVLGHAREGRLIELGLPRFDIETRMTLKDALGTLGMALPFDDLADFGAMTAVEPLKIGDVIHQANITTDESGTEAAAATAVVMSAVVSAGGDDEEPPLVVVFDRPFTFWLRDVLTGSIIFMGRVTDPSQTR